MCHAQSNVRIKTMFDSFVCRRAHVLFVFAAYIDVQTYTMWCFSSSWVTGVASLGGLSIFDCPFGIR
jgi:hypothetical protein